MADEPVKDRCIFCDAIVSIDDEVPRLDDEDAWRHIASEHRRDCECVRTRAGRWTVED